MTPELSGVWAKFDRACYHYGTFDGLLADWFASNGPDTRNAVEDDRWHVYRWVVRRQPDLDAFAVVAADMFHNLRATLDYLVYQLVIAAGNTPKPKQNSFPVVHLLHDRRRRDPVPEMLGHERDHLTPDLQVRHVPVEVDPIQALQVQHDVTIKQIVHRHRRNHDHHPGRTRRASPRKPPRHIVLAGIGDYLSPVKRLGFWLTKGRKIAPVPTDARVARWKDLMAGPHPTAPRVATTTDDPAAILFSGGTTGIPKGVVLSNHNLIAEGMQAAAWGGMRAGDAILPIFHGFGLGVCVNAAFLAGAMSILVPQFSAELVAKLLKSARPNLLVGVPTLYDALTKDPSLAKSDLSCLRACFSGADTLPRPVKERFEALVAAHGGKVKLLEGFGLTESVTAIMAMPLTEDREGSIGIPFPDMDAMICRYGTIEPLPPGEEGEICVAGPAVMLGYPDDPQATSQALRRHADGRTWLRTGDLGKRDGDGFFYFTARAKQLIKSSGFGVYPAQVEGVLYQHPLVAHACVIGVPDEAQIERVKGIVVLKDPSQESAATAQALIDFCSERLIKWSPPREIEFRRELPMTRIGKIDYKILVAEHIEKAAE